MTTQKSRWSRVYESSEEELIELLEALGVNAERWHIDAFESSEPITHDYDVTLWCAEGSIVFNVDGKNISIQPGDKLRIPSGTTYQTTCGMTGCACYQVNDMV